jgi:hypothetical protein
MIDYIIVYFAAALVINCGTYHIMLVRLILKGFGQISEENKQLLKMEWVTESVAMYFIGVLVLVITIIGGPQILPSKLVYWIVASILFILAGFSLMTGARMQFENLQLNPTEKKYLAFHLKSCPFVKATSAILLILGSLI